MSAEQADEQIDGDKQDEQIAQMLSVLRDSGIGIGPTPEQVERGARAVAEHWGMNFERLDPAASGVMRSISRRVLNAAGPLVPSPPAAAPEAPSGPDNRVHLIIDGVRADSPPRPACGAPNVQRGSRDASRTTCTDCGGA